MASNKFLQAIRSVNNSFEKQIKEGVKNKKQYETWITATCIMYPNDLALIQSLIKENEYLFTTVLNGAFPEMSPHNLKPKRSCCGG